MHPYRPAVLIVPDMMSSSRQRHYTANAAMRRYALLVFQYMYTHAAELFCSPFPTRHTDDPHIMQNQHKRRTHPLFLSFVYYYVPHRLRTSWRAGTGPSSERTTQPGTP
jgi:hypothetical protein